MMRRGWAVVAVEQVAELTEKDKHREQIRDYRYPDAR